MMEKIQRYWTETKFNKKTSVSNIRMKVLDLADKAG